MKISVATYSLRHLIRKESYSFPKIAELLKNWNVNAVEINNSFIKPQEIKNTVEMFSQNGIETVLFTIDGNNFFQRKDKKRKEQFDWMKNWLDPVHEAGIKMVRANMGHKQTRNKQEALKEISDTFRPILEYSEKLGITFVYENHGGLSSDIEFQLMVKEQFPGDSMGFLLDTGNYKPKSQVYKNIPKLGKSIKVVHAKMYEFDENGDETKLEFPRIIKLLTENGFDGNYSVEYEGSLPDLEGVEKSLQLLRKCL